jgi:hypothetical protein
LRRLISIGIAAYLLWQIALPLRYYLRENRRDERFAWRIFSTLTVPPYRCAVRVTEVGGESVNRREVDLQHTLHDAWITLLQFGQDAVAERFLRVRCGADPRVGAVQLSRVCRRPDGAPAPHMETRLDCQSGDISTSVTMQ